MRWRLPVLALMAAATVAMSPYGALIELTRNGEFPDDNYGEAVAGGGDVDGDGHADHVVTAIYNDQVASAAGKAYLYFGGAPPSVQSDLTFVGEAADDQFGVSAAVGGDFNGDGYADIVVGARFNDRAAKDAGAAFVYFGGPRPGGPGGMDAAPDLVLTGEAADDWFGNSVDFAGDVNGDGYDDIIVGAPYNDDHGSAAGKAYIYFGGPSPDATPDVLLYGDVQSDSHFGWSVSHAGDVNGDGYADVIAGARLYGSGGLRSAGRVYVFFGGPSPDGAADVVMTGEHHDDWFGNTVAAAGDFNGDGYDDVAVGAIYWDDATDPLNVKSAAGKVYVFYGGPGSTMDAAADWTAAGEQANEQFGFSIAPAGDVDGDGAGDLLAGGHFYNDTSGPVSISAVGKAYLFFGAAPPATPSPSAGFTRVGLAANDQMGHAVAGAGDGNGDGLADLLAGAHYADVNGSGSGSAILDLLDCLDLEVDAAGIRWGGCGGGVAFDLRRGQPSGFPSGDFGGCIASATTARDTSDAAVPSPGGIFSYLVSARHSPGPDALGFGNAGRARPPQTPCP